MSTYSAYHQQYYLDHRDELIRYNAETRKLLKKFHMCRECRKTDAYTLAGHARCADCVEKDTEYHRKVRGYQPAWKRVKKEKPETNYPRGYHGICYQCNKRLQMDGRTLCAECYAMKLRIAQQNFGIQMPKVQAESGSNGE